MSEVSARLSFALSCEGEVTEEDDVGNYRTSGIERHICKFEIARGREELEEFRADYEQTDEEGGMQEGGKGLAFMPGLEEIGGREQEEKHKMRDLVDPEKAGELGDRFRGQKEGEEDETCCRDRKFV